MCDQYRNIKQLFMNVELTLQRMTLNQIRIP